MRTVIWWLGISGGEREGSRDRGRGRHQEKERRWVGGVAATRERKVAAVVGEARCGCGRRCGDGEKGAKGEHRERGEGGEVESVGGASGGD